MTDGDMVVYLGAFLVAASCAAGAVYWITVYDAFAERKSESDRR